MPGSVRTGTSAPPAPRSQIGYWADNVMAAERLGVPDLFRVVDRDSVRELIDTPRLHGGIYTSMGATVQPARLARGIRRALLQRGVRIYEQSPVTRFGAGTPAVAETPGGTVRAGVAIVALNAWAAHWKRFRRLLTVRGSYIALTAPAPEKLEEIRWTNGMGLWDHRAALHYVRTTPDGRIAFGVGGMQPGLARSIGPRFSWDERAVRIAAEDLYRMFPSFADVPIEAAWGGPIDVAGHHLPFFGSLERGNVHYGHGYTGNGVGPSHLGGQILATMALGKDERAPASAARHRATDALPAGTDPFTRRVRREPGDLAQGSARGPGGGAESHRGLRRAPPAPDGIQPGPMTPDGVIVTEHLTKSYGATRGIVDVSLTVEAGEVFGFLGPNGAGKTTTIRTLLDFIRPTSGRATVFGMESATSSVEIHRRVGYLPGEFVPYEHLTGREYLDFFAALRGGVDRELVDALADRLQSDLSAKVASLSHGNKQKLGVIQAFMHRPALLILDEPTQGLDPIMQQRFHELVLEARAAGQSVFLSSHDLPEVERVCDRVGIIRDGRLITVEDIGSLKTRAARELEIRFASPVPADAFTGLPGVRAVEVHGDVMRCTVVGTMDGVVKAAARFDVVDLTSHEPTLEDIFLTFYGSDAEAAT